MPAIPIESNAHWRQLRAQHLGGTEVPALFNEHQYLTPYELWHRKAGLLPEPDLMDDERVFWGSLLEPAIAAGVARRTGWNIRKVRHYYSARPGLALGGSLDYEISGHPKGPGVLEIKTVDGLIARRWGAEPPLAYQIQLQVYLALSGRAWGAMAVLVGGNELRLVEYESRPRAIEIIERRVAEFWESIEAGIPPAPNYAADAETISQLYRNAEAGKSLDLTGDNRLPSLLTEYEHAAGMRRRHEREAKALRAEILVAIGDAEVALCGEWTIKASTVAGTPDRVIDESMIGERLRGREGYRGLHVSKRKEGA